ncbi:MAG: hypothetical protein ABMA25_16060, partial [Ilumatobacteraceae bacterium]
LPPDAPNSSLYGFTGAPPAEANIHVPKGDIYVQNGFDFGQFTSSAQIYNTEGKELGRGSARGSDPWEVQAAAVADAAQKAEAEAKAAIAAAVEAETRRLAAEADKRAAEQAEKEKAAKEQAAKDKAEKDKAAEEAKKKGAAGEEEAKKAAEEAKKKKGGLSDPDAGTPIDPRLLTQEQFATAVAAGNGSYFTHVGDTGILALVTPGDYVDPTIFIIHLDPDYEPFVATDTPDIGGQAGPDYDPNLPQGPTGGSLPPSGTNS